MVGRADRGRQSPPLNLDGKEGVDGSSPSEGFDADLTVEPGRQTGPERHAFRGRLAAAAADDRGAVRSVVSYATCVFSDGGVPPYRSSNAYLDHVSVRLLRSADPLDASRLAVPDGPESHHEHSNEHDAADGVAADVGVVCAPS